MSNLSYNPAPRQVPPQGASLNLLHPSSEGLLGCYVFGGDKGPTRNLVDESVGGFITSPAFPTPDGLMTKTMLHAGDSVPFPLVGATSFTIQFHLWLTGTVSWLMYLLRARDLDTLMNFWGVDGLISGGYGGIYAYSGVDDYMKGQIPTDDWLGYYNEPLPVVSTFVLDEDKRDSSYFACYRDGKKTSTPNVFQSGTWYGLRGSARSVLQFGINGNPNATEGYHIGSIMMWNRPLAVREIQSLGVAPYEMLNWPIGYRGPEEPQGAPYHYHRRQRERLAGAGSC